jgi:hypothetical protein
VAKKAAFSSQALSAKRLSLPAGGRAPGVFNPTARPAAAIPVSPRPVPQRAMAASVGRGRRATSVPKRPRALLNDTGSRAARPVSGARTSAARAPAWWEAEPRRSACSWAGASITAAFVRAVVRPRPFPFPLPSVCGVAMRSIYSSVVRLRNSRCQSA